MPAPSVFELERLLETLIHRIPRTLVRTGVLIEDPEYPWLDLHPDSGVIMRSNNWPAQPCVTVLPWARLPVAKP